MEITDKLVEHLANLAKLQFTSTEKEAIKGDLQKILGFFEQISSLDTEGVKPLVHVHAQTNVFRPDEVRSLISKQAALKNAPLHNNEYIKVPKVIQK